MHVKVVDATGSVILTLFDEVTGLLLKKPASMFLEETMDKTATHIVPLELRILVDSCHNFEMKTHSYFDKKSYVSFRSTRLFRLIYVIRHFVAERKELGMKTNQWMYHPILKSCAQARCIPLFLESL